MSPIDRIKYDFKRDELVYRWPSEEITLGSQLIVNESQEAIFYKGGQALDLFGPGTHTLSSGNLPLLRALINLPFGGKSPFSAEVYFINKTVGFAQNWGTTSPIMLLDPRYRVTIPLRSFGQYAVRVENSREFVVQVVGTTASTQVRTSAKDMLLSPIVACIQQAFGDYLVEKRISALELPAQTMALGDHVMTLLRARFKTFGIELINFALESINFDPKDESVARLRTMLDEAARLDIVGDAYRRNQDFYQTDRQFDVLQGAADAGGGAGNVMGAALGVGMGFGIAGPAGELARKSMAPQPSIPPKCPNCSAPYAPGAKFCNDCGTDLHQQLKLCSNCKAENSSSASFCKTCGSPLNQLKCKKCGASLGQTVKFCNVCGEKA